jgi:DNA-binding transcriptional LysR family regulator
MFDWNELKVFLAVTRGGSTLAAAKALKINQTTVARRLEALESDLGLKLFERGQGGSRLTEAGQKILPDAERMEAVAAGLSHRARGHQRGLVGAVRVTATEILANVAITPALASFRDAYPDLKVELIVTDQPLDMEGGEADVALRAGEILTEGDLVGRKVAEFPCALYASRNYLLDRGVPASVEDLRRHDLIAGDGVNTPLPGVGWMLGQLPGQEPVIRFNSLTNMLQALKAGMGVGPFGCLAADLEPELVRLIPVPEVTTTWIVTRRELKDTPRVRAFIDFFVPHFSQLQKTMRARGELAQQGKMAALEAALATRAPVNAAPAAVARGDGDRSG